LSRAVRPLLYLLRLLAFTLIIAAIFEKNRTKRESRQLCSRDCAWN